VDLTRVLAAPLATMLLADLGADVIKIEEPTRGDDTRAWYPPYAETLPSAPPETKDHPPESTYFLAANRNKRSLGLNLKHPEGLAIVHKLIQSADILVENFVTGKLATMGLGYEDCRKINPRLVYASITGYGQTGPYAKMPGYDVVIEAEAGLMHITGEPDRPPSKVGVAATDIATGLYAHGAIMAGLLSRHQTGQGLHIDVNLFDSQIAGLANVAANYLVAGQEAGRHGTSHPSIVPYQVFPCQDGYLMIGAGNEKQFKILAEQILERPAMAQDPRFANNGKRVENRKDLIEGITEALMERPRDYWVKKIHGKGVPFAPINNIQQTFAHPQAKARGIVVEAEHERGGKLKMVAPAVHYNGQRMPVNMAPPWLGQHTVEILKENGYDDAKIAELRSKQVI